MDLQDTLIYTTSTQTKVQRGLNQALLGPCGGGIEGGVLEAYEYKRVHLTTGRVCSGLHELRKSESLVELGSMTSACSWGHGISTVLESFF